MNPDVEIVLRYLRAAQSTLALYDSPRGPTNLARCHEILVSILETPELLRAQMALLPDNAFVMLIGEPKSASIVL